MRKSGDQRSDDHASMLFKKITASTWHCQASISLIVADSRLASKLESLWASLATALGLGGVGRADLNR